MDDYVTVDAAAISTGIAARTIRYWIANGKLTATAEKRGRLVRLGDVERIGAMTGRRNGNGSDNGKRQGSPVATAVATAAPAAIAADHAALAVIRDEWIRPLVAEMGQLREDLGRERVLREQAEQERDELRARLETVRSPVRRGERATPAQPPARTNAPPEGVGEESAPSSRGRPAWWRRFLFGET